MPAPLALLLVVAAVLAAGWALLLPPFQGPDESDHFAYVQHLAETGKAPSSTSYSGAGTHSSEETAALDGLGLRMLMGAPDARPLWDSLDLRAWNDFERQVTERQRADGDGLNPIAKNPPLYYAYQAVVYHASPDTSLFGRLLTMRLANALLFLVAVVCAWLAAAELTKRTWVRTLTAAIVAVQPQMTATAGIVNADTLLIAVWSAFTALAIRTLVRGPSLRRVTGLALLAAASALTHGRGLALLPPLVCVLGLAYWRHRPPLRAALGWSAACTGLLAAALALFRLFTTTQGGTGGTLYGGQTGYLEQGGFSLWGFAAQVWQFFLPKLPGMPTRIGPDFGFRQMYVESFFGKFGSLEVLFPNRVYTALTIAAVLGLAGLVAAAWVRRRELRPVGHVVLGLVAICGSLILLLQLVSYLALLGGPDALIVGRYALPLIVPFALAIAFVASSLPRRWGPLFGSAILALGLGLQLSGLIITVERFYV